MSNHFLRPPGSQSQPSYEPGFGHGLPLSEVYQSSIIPISVSVEILAGLADILATASRRDTLHGNLSSSSVCLNSEGCLLVNGYGRNRTVSNAPEGYPVGISSDVYGLGVIMLEILNSPDPVNLPKDHTEHENTIIQYMLSIDWQE